MSAETSPRICAFCEYFDGGGERLVLAARAGAKLLGDCHCRYSPRFTTASDDTCNEFVLDSCLRAEVNV